MSCCGSKRAATSPGNPPAPTPRRTPTGPPEPLTPLGSLRLEYVGATRFTVVGPKTGRRYDFARPGAVVEVHLADWQSLAALPQLRTVRR
jgi:hypothetical protein